MVITCNGIIVEVASNNITKNHNLSAKGRVVTFCDVDDLELDSLEQEVYGSDELHENATTMDQSTYPKRLDIANGGLQTIPEVVLQTPNNVEELLAGQNKLQEIALTALSTFSNLRILRLPGNDFRVFPEPLLHITAPLAVLDLADNLIQTIPDEIGNLDKLEELLLPRNALIDLPNGLRYLQKLRLIACQHNYLQKLPPFLCKSERGGGIGNMRTMGLVDMYSQKVNNLLNHHSGHGQERDESNQPLADVNLRANQLKGNIILGNYGNITKLDVSDNLIKTLDVHALDKLIELHCSRNQLVELTVNGNSLTHLVCSHNKLTVLTMTVSSSSGPSTLRHLDISHNSLTELPDFLIASGCPQLQSLSATHNHIGAIPEHLFGDTHPALHTLHLGHNRLHALPDLARRKSSLRELYLSNNAIEDLPDNFFYVCEQLRVLNVASNKLRTLPIIGEGVRCQLEQFYATDNQLTDRILDSLAGLNQLRILHAAYNRLTTFPESCAMNWADLEEVILSGNRLQHLPENMANLNKLRVLRVHSNQLQTVPQLARTTSLRVLDLAHNQLDKINLMDLVPKRLQFLDLSCNNHLTVDSKHLQICKAQRQVSLVDTSGKNRNNLPTSPNNNFTEVSSLDPAWKCGFSETSGSAGKLYVSQLRLPGFCNTEGLFGLFDGEPGRIVPSVLVKAVPKLLLEERTIKETANEYMKYTLLAAHRELKQHGQMEGVAVTLCHLSRSNSTPRASEIEGYHPAKQKPKYILRVASVGESFAMLVRQTGCVKLTPSTTIREPNSPKSPSFPLVIPDPEISEVTLNGTDEYLVLANRNVWQVMDADEIAAVVRSEFNIILAAKKVQDLAQGYGMAQNLSVIVVRFQNLASSVGAADMDQVMRELRHTIKRKPAGGLIAGGFCRCGCCCEPNANTCCHTTAAAAAVAEPSTVTAPLHHFARQPSSGRSDRSSPSGQSEKSAFESAAAPSLKVAAINGGSVASRKSAANYSTATTNERRSLRGGVVRAVRARIEEEREREKERESDSMSEEQFKCWEYMLEQNTQLLFDKELNTISRGGGGGGMTKRPSIPSMMTTGTNLSRTQIKALSTSSPQLALHDQLSKKHHACTMSEYNMAAVQSSNVPFLSKHFGSARSFHHPAAHSSAQHLGTAGSGLLRAMRFNSGRLYPPIQGGPNAAYFGSLQRLMPYNLEYDFAVMQERIANGEALDEEADRMHQYWGVATTEL